MMPSTLNTPHISALLFAISLAPGCAADQYLNDKIEVREQGQWQPHGGGCRILERSKDETGGRLQENDPGASNAEGLFSMSSISTGGKIVVEVKAGKDEDVVEFDRKSLSSGDETIIEVTDLNGKEYRVTLWGDVECYEPRIED